MDETLATAGRGGGVRGAAGALRPVPVMGMTFPPYNEGTQVKPTGSSIQCTKRPSRTGAHNLCRSGSQVVALVGSRRRRRREQVRFARKVLLCVVRSRQDIKTSKSSSRSAKRSSGALHLRHFRSNVVSLVESRRQSQKASFSRQVLFCVLRFDPRLNRVTKGSRLPIVLVCRKWRKQTKRGSRWSACTTDQVGTAPAS